MTLGIRKLVVIGLIGGVFLLANVMIVAHWLREMGLIEWAGTVRKDFLTGTAITVILALLILVVGPANGRTSIIHRCSVCSHVLVGRGPYCSECGSKQ